MAKTNKHQIIAATLAMTLSRSEIKPACMSSINDCEVKNKWRGGSRGKGGKTKWPRR